MATKKKNTKKKKAPKMIIEVHLTSDGKISSAMAAKSLSDLKIFETGTDDQIAIDVKTLILGIVGNKKIRPRDLPDSHRLVEDLRYNDDLLDFLHAALNNFVSHKKAGASISQAQMDKCKTAGNCVELVKSKI